MTFVRNYKQNTTKQNTTKQNTNKCMASITRGQIKTPTKIITKMGIARQEVICRYFVGTRKNNRYSLGLNA